MDNLSGIIEAKTGKTQSLTSKNKMEKILSTDYHIKKTDVFGVATLPQQ